MRERLRNISTILKLDCTFEPPGNPAKSQILINHVGDWVTVLLFRQAAQ